LESIRRVSYVAVMRQRDISPRRADPNDELFDPLRAAALHEREGNRDEAFWLTFLFVHFGKHATAGWRYVREVYGRLGDSTHWTWPRVSADPEGFRTWLRAHKAQIMREGIPRGFGNHRKYQSLDADSSTGTGAAVKTYVDWVAPPRTHEELFNEELDKVDGNPFEAFDRLYRSMSSVTSFGRTARFDYLTMVSKLGLAEVEPGSTYLLNATGPAKGARLLFLGASTAQAPIRLLEQWSIELANYLSVGMQVMEDAMCNWQKSPTVFKPFRG